MTDTIEQPTAQRYAMTDKRKKELEDYLWSRYQHFEYMAQEFNKLSSQALLQYEKIIGDSQ